MRIKPVVAFVFAVTAAVGVPASEIRVSPSVDGLKAAVEAVRRRRAAGELGTDASVEIVLEKGRHVLTSPLTLTAEDSGIRFAGPSDGGAVVDGGFELPEFSIRSDGVWETAVPKDAAFEQVWVGDRLAIRARSPNDGWFYMWDSDDEAPRAAFFAEKADVRPLAGLDPAALSRVLCTYWLSWNTGCSEIRSFDAKTGRVGFREPSGGWKLFTWNKTRPRYRLENFRAALDAPGEWFHDVEAERLLYIPRPGETPQTVRAVVPRNDVLVAIRGNRTEGKVVRNVSLRNIVFEHAALGFGTGLRPSQAVANVRTAAILADDAEGLVIENVTVRHVGGHGIWLRKGCIGSRLSHALVEDLGVGGIYLGATTWDKVHRDRNTSDVEISDCIVRGGGRLMEGACGIWVGHAHDCRVVHNDIADFFYTGISAGWTWGYAETCNRDNEISFNRIRDIGQGRLSDMGGIYVLGDSRGTQVCGNWISDVNGYLWNGSPAWGLYTDEGARGYVFASNLVERCRDGAVHQHFGKDNLFANNVLVDFGRHGVRRSVVEKHVSFRLERNIFRWTDPAAGACASGGSLDGLEAEGNIYWLADGKPGDKAFGGLDWSGWQKSGRDANGAVVDPGFADPQRGDWRLRPDSPAIVRGFSPFDWTEAGVLKRNAAWRRRAESYRAAPFRDIPAPKTNLRLIEKAEFDAENLSAGVILNGMDVLKPFNVAAGKAGGFMVADADAYQGKKSLVFTEVPGINSSWQPHINMPCMVTDGVVRVSFACRIGKDARMSVELRDYASGGGEFRTGCVVGCTNGRFHANGKSVCEVPADVWTHVELKVPLTGGKGWSCTVSPRGMAPTTVSVDGWLNRGFSMLTWIGFLSLGPESSSWALDDFRLSKDP